MSINQYLITKKWYCDVCTHHYDKHTKKGCCKDCKEFYVEAMTEINYMVRSKLVDKWYFFYNHGYILRYHWKPTHEWFDEFVYYSDSLIQMNKKYLDRG